MPTTSSTWARHATHRTVFLLAAVIATSWLAGCERAKTRLDREVDRLCAIDGGVKVFETVEVPPEYLPERGEIFPQYANRPFEQRLGPEYQLKTSTTYLVDGNPRLSRFEALVIRRSDGKVLGQSISYSRVGGDLPGPAHPSSYGCPPLAQLDLERRVFVKKESDK
jgi:hypothetical protein